MNTQKNTNSIEVFNLNQSIGRKHILKDLSFKIPNNTIAGFLGPNGSGKTTTLRVLLGLLPLQKGSVSLLNFNILKNRTKAAEQIGAVVENPNFIESMTATENLFWFGSLYKPVTQSRIDEVIELVGLKEAAKNKFSTFSSGMKQRLGVAFGILHKPKLLILDEPTSGMDPMGRVQMRKILQQIHNMEETTIFLSSHLLDEVQKLCNYVVIINSGETKAEGYVNKLLSEKKEKYEIRLPDEQISKAKEIIKNIPNAIEDVTDSPTGLIVTLKSFESYKLNKILLDNNIKVSALIPQEASLEDAFINITKAADDTNKGESLQ